MQGSEVSHDAPKNYSDINNGGDSKKKKKKCKRDDDENVGGASKCTDREKLTNSSKNYGNSDVTGDNDGCPTRIISLTPRND